MDKAHRSQGHKATTKRWVTFNYQVLRIFATHLISKGQYFEEDLKKFKNVFFMESYQNNDSNGINKTYRTN